MNLEVLAWAPSNKEWEQAITTTLVPSTGQPLARYGYGLDGMQIMPPVLWAHPGLNIDEIGEIWEADPEIPPEELPDPVLKAPGHHVNLRFHEPLADYLTEGLAQTDAEGNLLPLFERTRLLELFPGANWDTLTGPAPPGYIGPQGVKLFDPALVVSRTRVWA
jgi:hypothetical protein